MNLPRIVPLTIFVIHGRNAAEEIPRSTLKKKRLTSSNPRRTSLDQKRSIGTMADVAMKTERSPHPMRANER